MESEETYVEDQIIVLPNLVDGPTAIGDLWDCHKSKLVGLNLFGEKLEPQHLQINDMSEVKYTLTRVRSIMDRYKLLQVSDDVTLELLAGLIKVDGWDKYEIDESYISEELLCYYDQKTFSIEAIPSVKEVMDPKVVKKILKGEQKATHVVMKTILGAEMLTSIRIRETISNSKDNILKNIFGNLITGPISALTKVALGKLDTMKSNDLAIDIKMNSRPPSNSQPVTVFEMFQLIEGIGKTVKEAKHPSCKSKEFPVSGTPLRFYLIPIKHLLDVSVKKLYLQIMDVILEKTIGVLTTLKDFQIHGFLRKRILENEPCLKTILLDQSNQFALKISISEQQMRALAKGRYSNICQMISKYKVRVVNQHDLLKISNTIDKMIDVTLKLQEIQRLTSEGRMNFLTIRNGDIKVIQKTSIFTDSMDMIKWYEAQKPIKVLLRVGGNYVNNGCVICLYDIGRLLKNIGVEVGIAAPVISDGQYDMAIKTDDTEVKYRAEEISFVIQILLFLVNKADQTSSRLFTIYALLNGIKLPFQKQLVDLHKIIAILNEIKDVKVADSYVQLHDVALKMDGRWKLVMDLNAFDSAAESLNTFRFLNIEFRELGVDWIIGNFGIESCTEYSNAPLLFVFKDKELQALCLDNVDVLLLIEAFKPEGECILKLLCPDMASIEKSCFHKTRLDFAFKVNQRFQPKVSILEEESKISETWAFSSTINKNVEALQVLVRGMIANDEFSIWGAMANILQHEFLVAKSILKSQTWTKKANGDPIAFTTVNPLHLDYALKELLSIQDAMDVKIQLTLEDISYFQTNAQKGPENIDKCIDNLISDIHCCAKLKERLVTCQKHMDYAEKLKNTEKILKQHLGTRESWKVEVITLFIRLLEIAPGKLKDFFDTDLLPKLVAHLSIDESKYPSFHTKLSNLVKECDYYKLLQVLHQIKDVENHRFLVCTKLEALTHIRDAEPLSQLLKKIAVNKLSQDQYRWLFSNPKFIYVIEINSSCSRLLQTFKVLHCQNPEIHDYIPNGLKGFLKEDNDSICPDIIHNTDEALDIFQKITSQNHIPDNFEKVLGESVSKNLELKTSLKSADALLYWSEKDQVFTKSWTCGTIKEACKNLREWKCSLDHNLTGDKENVTTFNIDILSEPTRLPDNYSDEENQNQENGLDGTIQTQTWIRLLGSCSETIDLRNYLEIRSLLVDPPKISVYEEGYIVKLLPYILQQIKMWGVHAIKQENLVKLNASEVSVTNNRRFKKFVFNAVTSQSATPVGNSTKIKSNCPVARIDIVTCLNAVCSKMVFQDLLRVISQFPVALPLVLQNNCNNKWDYVCLVSLLKCISVRWELQPGVVIHNQLFIDPFKMIVAFRVGSASSGCSGKSTILNQVMGPKHMFSSLAGPGADKGVPLTLCGSAELVVLLQETCSYALWETVSNSHYSRGLKDVVMLVNVHGDALELPDAIELLKGMATSFIAFFMPCTKSQLETRSMKIQQMLDNTEDIVYVLVDPTPECKTQSTNTINTNQLMLDGMLETVRSALDAAIQMGASRTVNSLSNNFNRIRLSPNIFTKQSELLITSIKNLGCKKARSTLKLQKGNPKYIDNYPALVMSTWQHDINLAHIIRIFVQILNFPIESRLIAFAHLDHELSLLTANESMKIREKLGKLQEERRRALNLAVGSTLSPVQKRIMEKIRLTMDELDDMSLGMEHLYRELGRIYQAAQCSAAPSNKPILSLPALYAELLIWGYAIEILDGDIGDMPGPWLNSICHSVCKNYPDLRIFTISIIGLQSSGKSTLLNALFACKFAVSVGRCTRGLFMRLIFLNKSLSAELNIDAILLIDTEGLGAPEKLNDLEAEYKDRLLATFAMSISNLTLINVLGESVRDLTDILQIVIVTMANLEKADISPDILMVQHLSERDSNKTMKGADEFCMALEEAVSLTNSKDLTMKIRRCKSLQKLEQRVKNGQLLKQFRPFKNGASANAPPSQEYHEDVVDLYKTILSTIKQVASPQNFHKWHELIQNYWAAVSSQEFSLRFKNIQEVHEFINRGSAIAKVKAALDGAFRIHKESCEPKIRQQVIDLLNNSEKIRNWKLETEHVLQSVTEAIKLIPNSCEQVCSKCSEAVLLKNKLFRDLVGTNSQQETETTINKYLQKKRVSVIKHLSQMVEVLRMRHGWLHEFDAIIERILIETKDLSNCTVYESGELIVDEIWSQFEKEISKYQQVTSAKQRIFDEVRVEYLDVNLVLNHFHRESTTKESLRLRDMKAIDFKARRPVNATKNVASHKGQNSCLSFQQFSFLESKLNSLPSSLVEKYGSEHFEDGMVRMLKEDINEVLQHLVKEHIQQGKLMPEFKWTVHVYAILNFVEVMTLKEEEWNRHNNPSYILLQNEDLYRKKINIRLKHGFGYDAEGRIVGDFLLKAICKRGQMQGTRACIDSVCANNWLLSTENVRLTYFSHLARQVSRGCKELALTHFSSPKTTIENWFQMEVDSQSTEIGINKFTETVESELEYVVQEIRNQKNCGGIKTFTASYLIQVENMEYNPVVDLDSDSAADFDLLQTAVLKKLDEEKEQLKLEKFTIKLSTHSEIKSLLGCTENCYWCGSLCWGQAGHEENMDSTKKHHACHQPEGLIGTCDKYDHSLLILSCDKCSKNTVVYWPNCKDGMTWQKAKTYPDFVDWTFTPHHKSEFNDLMKWFFLNLHENIASSRNVQPAKDCDLYRNGFFNLFSLDHILATVKSSI